MDKDKKRSCSTCQTTDLILKERCDDCDTLSCIICEVEVNKGLCASCHEEELAYLWPCNNCGKEFPHGKIMIYDCVLCDGQHETCLPCYESWRSPCPGASNI